MLAPLSWLKDYVDIKLTPEQLAKRLTEVGLGCEKITKINNDVIFELEITPNRPDWLSIIGIAREIAAITDKLIKYPKLHIDITKKPVNILPLDISVDLTISPRHTGLIIKGVTVKESPPWLKDKLLKIEQRPINNIVDITNFVMFELGNPLHAFNYDRINGHRMTITQASGGEPFKSVDGISYHLPKNAVIVRDDKDTIDLCGIKGGYNSATYNDTKTIFIWAPVEIPVLIRKTSQALGLRSEASSIFERGVNAGGTIDAIRRATDLILEYAGGEVVSTLYDVRRKVFNPWKVTLRLDRLAFILGIIIPEKEVLALLSRLHLSPRITKPGLIECTIPTYRNDLQIEEDLIEEVARLYGYNNFSKTLPTGAIPVKQIPYFKDYKIEQKTKQILAAAGFSEIYTYSLISEEDLRQSNFNPDKCLRVDNPVSREFEYLRPSLTINLKKALEQNKPNAEEINLFELGKVYLGKTLDKTEEPYYLSGISNTKTFLEVKGIVERLFWELGIKKDPTKFIVSAEDYILFELNFSQAVKENLLIKIYKSIPKYPPVIEDLALVTDRSVKIADLINEIKRQSPLITGVSLLDIYENTKTFHIIYQHPSRNLTTVEVSQIRQKMLVNLERRFKARLKE